MDGNIVTFREVQRFNQKWLQLIVIAIALINWYGAIEQLVLNRPFGSNPASDSVVLTLWVIFGIMFPIFFYSMKLIIEVKDDGLYVKFFPFHMSFKRFTFPSIKSYRAITYNPLRDYGGWGIRYGIKGKAYNVSGNRGVMIELMNGKKIMLGSQRPEEIVMSIEKNIKRYR